MLQGSSNEEEIFISLCKCSKFKVRNISLFLASYCVFSIFQL